VDISGGAAGIDRHAGGWGGGGFEGGTPTESSASNASILDGRTRPELQAGRVGGPRATWRGQGHVARGRPAIRSGGGGGSHAGKRGPFGADS
jgi:hypothetical protein